ISSPGSARRALRAPVLLVAGAALLGVGIAAAPSLRRFRSQPEAGVAPSAAPSAAPEAPTDPEPDEIDAGPSSGVVCAGPPCPVLDGYAPSCNPARRCAYARAVRSEPWHEHDGWIYVRAAAFAMGSRATREIDEVPKDETPSHTVALRRGFFVG